MISTPDRPRAGRSRAARLALAFVLGGALMAGFAPALSATSPGDAAALVGKARRALARNDGVAAEIHLKAALSAGAPREALAADMGEALLVQGKPDDAREWLGPQVFSRESGARGFRALARLERMQGNLPAAGAAFDRALALTPGDASLWVEIGRLRYAGGEHLLALDAASHALALDPRSARALEFKGQIVRDRFGLVAALAWFDAALAVAPDDLSVMGEQAATLGELGRGHEMLAITRQMLAQDPRNPQAFYLQAVLAARAGDTSLARAMLNRTGDRLKAVPGAMLLDAILELRAQNHLLAVAKLEALVKRQPANRVARELLASALFRAGQHKEVVARFGVMALREDATPYLLATVGRSHEMLGRRDLAAPFLNRAAEPGGSTIHAVPEGLSAAAALVASGELAAAGRQAEAERVANPGSAEVQIRAGDVQLALRRGNQAIERYRAASRVRLPAGLMEKMAAAFLLTGRQEAARVLVDRWLARNPSSRDAAWLAADLAARNGDWTRAEALLRHLGAVGGDGEVTLLARLSEAQLRNGKAGDAVSSALRAVRLQRANPQAARALGMALQAQGNAAKARRMLEKARRMREGVRLVASAGSALDNGV